MSGASTWRPKKYPGAYDLGQLIDTRDRRRIVGDYILTPLDIVNRRTFPDTVGISNGGRLDKHGYTVHAFYMINNWRGGMTYTPYRCLLPKGIDGVLVIGVGLARIATRSPRSACSRACRTWATRPAWPPRWPPRPACRPARSTSRPSKPTWSASAA